MNELGKYKAKELAEQEKNAQVLPSKYKAAMKALYDMYMDDYDDDDSEYDDLYEDSDYDDEQFSGRRLVERYYDDEDEEYYDDLYEDEDEYYDDEDYEEETYDEAYDELQNAYQDYINALYGMYDYNEDDFEAGYHWDNDYQTGLIES